MRRPVSTTLTEDQVEIPRRYGRTRQTEAGQILVRAGDASCDFVVLEGEVKVVDDFVGEARTMHQYLADAGV